MMDLGIPPARPVLWVAWRLDDPAGRKVEVTSQSAFGAKQLAAVELQTEPGNVDCMRVG